MYVLLLKVWDFIVTRSESLLMTSSADLELRVWRLATQDVSCLLS